MGDAHRGGTGLATDFEVSAPSADTVPLSNGYIMPATCVTLNFLLTALRNPQVATFWV